MMFGISSQSIAASNTALAAADTILNYSTSYRHEEEADRVRAPAQPAPAFFSIWGPLFSGLVAFGFFGKKASPSARLWHNVTSALGGVYAFSLVRKRFVPNYLSMVGMLISGVLFRRNLAPGESRIEKWIRFASEMYVGWLCAANAIGLIQLTERLDAKKADLADSTSVGLAQVGALTAAGWGINQRAGWKGVSAALVWGLAGVAFEKRSPKTVRVAAALSAAGLLWDLTQPIVRERRAKQEIGSSLAHLRIDDTTFIDGEAELV